MIRFVVSQVFVLLNLVDEEEDDFCVPPTLLMLYGCVVAAQSTC